VENFNYLGSILNADNKMNTEIAERIAKGNKTYCAIIKSKFLKKNTKMKIYTTMIKTSRYVLIRDLDVNS